MKSLHRLALLVPTIAIVAFAATPARAIEWQGWNAGLEHAKDSGRPVLVDVYTNWCGWCKRMDQDVYSRPDVSDYLATHFVLVRLNAESPELTLYQGRNRSARALASAFGVSGYPTTIFFTPGGDRLVNVPGYAFMCRTSTTTSAGFARRPTRNGDAARGSASARRCLGSFGRASPEATRRRKTCGDCGMACPVC